VACAHTEVPRKDAHAEWWCEQVSKETGESWRYAKLPYNRFHGKLPGTFASLIEMLTPSSKQSRLFELKTDGTK
jgi:hypothetical protein